MVVTLIIKKIKKTVGVRFRTIYLPLLHSIKSASAVSVKVATVDPFVTYSHEYEVWNKDRALTDQIIPQ